MNPKRLIRHSYLRRTLFFILFSFGAIYSNSQSYLNQIESFDQFKLLSGEPLSEKYGDIDALKIVVDVKTGKIFYCSSQDFKYHHDFCREELRYHKGILDFNNENYSTSTKRQFLLANLNYFKKQDLFVLELSASDQMVTEQIISLYQKTQESFYRDSILFLINTTRLQNENLAVHSTTPSELYNNQTFQAISKSSKKGILRIVEDVENTELSPNDIIIIKETPISLPNVAGIIVTKLQTPLSHLSILGHTRDIPIAAITGALKDSSILSLQNQWVQFSVLGSNYELKQTDSKQKFKPAKKAIHLQANLKVDSLIEVKNLKRRSYRFAGNKAHNFGILYQLSQKGNFKTPESAFVIPFYFYNQHALNSNTHVLINKLLLRRTELPNDSIKKMLKTIRKSIKNHEVDAHLLNLVESKIKSLGNYTRMRFRSSTNAEDAKGFSGAGLYQSKTGDLNNPKKPIDKAIKKVWASLWSYDAFMERSYFQINHREVYMGILVHRSFPSEEVNGVCISKNLYRNDYHGFVVNAQLGEESVVKPKKGVISDQFICYPDSSYLVYNQVKDIEIITTSNLNQNKLCMSKEEIIRLANEIERIKRHMYFRTYTRKEYNDYALDFEFKLDGKQRDLYIKQMRLFND